MEVPEPVEKLWRKYCEESDGSYMMSKSSFVYAMHEFNQPPVSGGEVEFPLPEFELIKSRFEAGDYDLNDVILRAFKLGQSKQASGREANRFEGWIECELPFLPSTGEYQVMDSDDNIFMCVYVDFGEDRGWQTDKYITSYRLEPLPTPPSK